MCSGLRVARAQPSGKFKSVDVSGVLSYSCEHVHFRPSATVDLQTTETYDPSLKGVNALLMTKVNGGTTIAPFLELFEGPRDFKSARYRMT